MDTYSYKGWLISDKFYKRALAVVGYLIVGQLFVGVLFLFLAMFFSILGVMVGYK